MVSLSFGSQRFSFEPMLKFFQEQHQGPQKSDPGAVQEKLKPLQPGKLSGIATFEQNPGS